MDEVIPDEILRGLGARKVSTVLEAQAIVHKKPGRHSALAEWHVALTGGSVMRPSYPGSAGEEGSYITYCCAIRSKRFVWLSDKWKDEHPTLLGVLRRSAFHSHATTWEELESRADFIASAAFSPHDTKNRCCGACQR